MGVADRRFSEKSQRAGSSPQRDTVRNDRATQSLAHVDSKWAGTLTKHQQRGDVALDGPVPGGYAGIKGSCAYPNFAGWYADPRRSMLDEKAAVRESQWDGDVFCWIEVYVLKQMSTISMHQHAAFAGWKGNTMMIDAMWYVGVSIVFFIGLLAMGLGMVPS